MINAKKQRKAIEWERLDISSRKLVITKGKFHANMGKIKDRNGIDLKKQKILRIHRRTIQKRSSWPR